MPHRNKPKVSQNKQPSGGRLFRQIFRWIIEHPAPIISTTILAAFTLVGGINDIIEFVQRWPTDNTSIILTSLGLICFALIIGFIYVLVNPPQKSFVLPRKVAQWGLIALTIVVISVWGYSAWQNAGLEKKTIILVANFEGPNNQDNIRISDLILRQLRQAVNKYDDTLIIPLKTSISEQDGGSQLAKTMGEKYHADLVLWGWYVVSNTDILVTLYIENLAQLQSIPLPSSQMYSPQALITELDHFNFQERLSDEMASLVLFVMGSIRYEAQDYQTATKLFSDIINNSDQAGFIVNRPLVHILRGNSYLSGQNYEAALEDYSQALDSNYAYAAYSNRSLIYMLVQKDYEKALVDLTKAIALQPPASTSEGLYNNRAVTYILSGEQQKALDDLNHAIDINPRFAFPYVNRALVYLLKQNYEQARVDLVSALALDNNLYFAYHVRCLVDTFNGDFDQAIIDCTNFLNKFTSQSFMINQDMLIAVTYNNRGMAYLFKNSFQEAINDFTQAISLSPDLAIAYFHRGYAYLKNNQFNNAIADYSAVLEMDTSSFPMLPSNFQIGDVILIKEGEQSKITDYIYFNRGTAYRGTGQIDKAISDFKTVQKMSEGLYLRNLASQQLKQLGVTTDP